MLTAILTVIIAKHSRQLNDQDWTLLHVLHTGLLIERTRREISTLVMRPLT